MINERDIFSPFLATAASHWAQQAANELTGRTHDGTDFLPKL